MITGRKMLLADDSITIQKVVDLTFADEGMQVTTVSNGEQAILKLEEVAPDIVLADIFMPGRSGYEVCEHIKRDERFRHIPVMLLVGSFEPFDEAEARRVGADDFLTKPFQSIRQLVGKVSALLSGGGDKQTTTDEDERTTQDLELPPEVTRAEKERAGNAEPPSEISLANTARLPRLDAETSDASSAGRESSFADMSYDDELIEAKPANDFSGSSTTAVSSPQPPTAPLSSADMEEAGIKEADAFSESQMQETIRNFSMEELKEEASKLRSHAPQMARAAAADDALLDLGEIESPSSSTREADDFILDLLDESPTRPAPASPPVEDTITAYQSAEAASEESVEAAPPVEFAEQQMLETAPLPAGYAESRMGGEERRDSFTDLEFAKLEEARAKFMEPRIISQGMEEARTVRLPETYEPEQIVVEKVSLGTSESSEATTDAPSPAVEPQTDGQIGLNQLAPEVIDAIARRVVEQMSEKVVQEIAWEVVPQLAELLIKRRLEEETKQ